MMGHVRAGGEQGGSRTLAWRKGAKSSFFSRFCSRIIYDENQWIESDCILMFTRLKQLLWEAQAKSGTEAVHI